ncbi:hypothetical protein RB594_002316 [Gaeumannomyces avenae]
MKSAVLTSLIGAASLASASPAVEKRQNSKVPHIVVRGNAFFAGNDRFFVRGIDYQPGGSSENKDPLADTKVCLRDLEKFKKLGVNTVRVYSTDNSKDHKACMDAYAAAGIYLLLDINNPMYSINRDKPDPSYNAEYLQSVFAYIDEFARYDNTMAFFSANEVVHGSANTSLAARHVKATTRDIKSYMAKRGLRQVPIGYSAADVSENRMQQAQYFNCGTDDERSDFFAFNDYSWCTSDFKTSGWDKKVEAFKDYGMPIFLSEYGCNENKRDFGELKALMSPDMTGVYSGGLMYEYTYEANKFGIVKLNGDNVEELEEFAAFQKAMKDFPAPTGLAGASTSQKTSQCPAKDQYWHIETTSLPAFPKDAQKYLDNGAGKGPGLNGRGSQNSGPPKVEEANPGSGLGGPANDSNDKTGNSKSAGASTGVSFFMAASALTVSVGALFL